jgi:hypothetical protein
MSKLHLIMMTTDLLQMFKLRLNMMQGMVYLEISMSTTQDYHLTPKILILHMVALKRSQHLALFIQKRDRQVCEVSI